MENSNILKVTTTLQSVVILWEFGVFAPILISNGDFALILRVVRFYPCLFYELCNFTPTFLKQRVRLPLLLTLLDVCLLK